MPPIANLAGFQRIELRPRRLADIAKTDTRVELFGSTFDTPIFSLPAQWPENVPSGWRSWFRPGRARKERLANSVDTNSTSVEEVAKALGTAPWYQFDMLLGWEGTEKMVKRAEDAGCAILVIPVDGFGGRNAALEN
jgi:4-hydroxymandelate oxidase